MRRMGIPSLRLSQVISALILSQPALAQDEEPSLDFLEYLGSWEGEDESWYVEVQIEETGDDDAEEADDNSPPEALAEHSDD